MMSKTPRLVIAIDGPSGSGKSSTSKLVAGDLGCAYLDTGSFYRALAWWCEHEEIGTDQAERVVEAARTLPMRVCTDPTAFAVAVAGQDITDQLHDPRISGMVSGYSNIRPARQVLTELMRSVIREAGRIVVEGRDITTVVAPDADVRILLQADPAARIARRERQLEGAADHETVTRQVVGRDRDDAVSSQFETPADGVILIDSTHLSLDEVVVRVEALVPERLRSPLG